MTEFDREVWRAAYDIYDWNHDMPNTDSNWLALNQSVVDFAEKYSWRDHPLVFALASAVLDCINEEVKRRENLGGPVQLSFLEGG